VEPTTPIVVLDDWTRTRVSSVTTVTAPEVSRLKETSWYSVSVVTWRVKFDEVGVAWENFNSPVAGVNAPVAVLMSCVVERSPRVGMR
jgi:hypothetical protein